jgi:hypothetical protein
MLLLLLVSKQVIGGRIVRQYGLHCEGIDYKSMLCYLAKTKGPSKLISITYILFPTKMQKGKPGKKDLPY